MGAEKIILIAASIAYCSYFYMIAQLHEIAKYTKN